MTTLQIPPGDALSTEALRHGPSYDAPRSRTRSLPDAIANLEAQDAANRANDETPVAPVVTPWRLAP